MILYWVIFYVLLSVFVSYLLCKNACLSSKVEDLQKIIDMRDVITNDEVRKASIGYNDKLRSYEARLYKLDRFMSSQYYFPEIRGQRDVDWAIEYITKSIPYLRAFQKGEPFEFFGGVGPGSVPDYKVASLHPPVMGFDPCGKDYSVYQVFQQQRPLWVHVSASTMDLPRKGDNMPVGLPLSRLLEDDRSKGRWFYLESNKSVRIFIPATGCMDIFTPGGQPFIFSPDLINKATWRGVDVIGEAIDEAVLEIGHFYSYDPYNADIKVILNKLVDVVQKTKE